MAHHQHPNRRPPEVERSRPARRMRVIYRDTDWMAGAGCRDHRDVDFFPGKGARTEPARHICADCEVRLECLTYALDHEIVDGVWGGQGPKELRGLLQARSAEIDLRAPHRPAGQPASTASTTRLAR